MFKKREILPLTLIIIAFLAGALLYSSLPEKLPTHWNAQREVDDWAGKNFAVLFFPLLTLGMYLLMIFLPRIDPLRKNYPRFAATYFCIRSILVIFFVALYLFTLSAALGVKLNINYFIVPILSLLFVVIGIFLPKIKKNYFVGIKTPWTLHSEETWNKTHQVAGKIFIAAGLISLLGLVFFKYVFWIVIFSAGGAAAFSFVYSYFVFRKIGGFNNKRKV